MISRRKFLRRTAACAPVIAGASILLRPTRRGGGPQLGAANAAAEGSKADRLREILRTAPPARFWIGLDSEGVTCKSCHESEAKPEEDFQHPPGAVRCLLCAQGCSIRDGERGECRARLNDGGTLRSLVYGRPVSVNVDPIEKKPFYHFLPGSKAFSLSTTGCPLRCRFCQNWEISQARPEDYETRVVSPAEVVAAATSRKCPVIAFTYNEPTVFTEYLTDIARRARKEKGGPRCVLVSCGFMQEDPLKEMCEVLDAIKIDLKGFSEDFYREVSGAELKPVLRSIKRVHESRVHLEIVNLVVPTLNDSGPMLRELVSWIAGELGPDVPVHFTRFHPDYQLLNLPPTPLATLERARNLAMEKGIRYAFLGNWPDHAGNNTYCPSCKAVAVKRTGMFLMELNVKEGKCSACGQPIAGVWS